jgi:hypothetical protein
MWSDLTSDEQALLELGVEDNFWLVELRGQFPNLSRAKKALARLLELQLVTLEHLGKVVSTDAAMAFIADPSVWDDSQFGFDATEAGKGLYFGQR